MRGWKKIFHANGNQKKTGVAILVSDKKELKIKNSKRDKKDITEPSKDQPKQKI